MGRIVKSNPMTQEELGELQTDVSAISLRDVQTGRVLDTIVSHLARLNGLDYPIAPQSEQVETPVEQVSFPEQEGTTNGN